jgi:hypothetical protein
VQAGSSTNNDASERDDIKGRGMAAAAPVETGGDGRWRVVEPPAQTPAWIGPVARSALDNANRCSTSVLMEVETLGAARSLGWKVHMRCADGYREGTRSMRRCVYRKQLDLETLVVRAARTFRFRAWSRGSCVRLVEVGG